MLYAIRYTLHVVRYTLYAIRYTLYTARSTLYIIRYTLYGILSTLHALRRTLYALCVCAILVRVPLVRAQGARADGCTFLVKMKIK